MYMDDLFQYIPENTLFHRTHPLTKLVWAFTLIAISWINVWATIFSLLIVLTALFIAKIVQNKPSIVKSYVSAFSFILIINWILYSFAYPARTWILDRVLSFEGLYLASLLTTRILIILLSIQVFFTTTTPEELEDFLLSLKFSPSITLALMLTLTFIPTILNEAKRIHEAQLLRGLAKSKFIKKISGYISSLIMPLIISSLNRANRVAEVLEIYGVPTDNRTKLCSLKFTKSDIIILTMTIITVVITTYLGKFFFEHLIELIPYF